MDWSGGNHDRIGARSGTDWRKAGKFSLPASGTTTLTRKSRTSASGRAFWKFWKLNWKLNTPANTAHTIINTQKEENVIHIGLFEGIGGFSLAAKWMGWKTYATCEINPFGRKILSYYWPNAY